MDKTLRKARRPNMQRRQKNVRAWRRFALDSGICPYCGHDSGSHLTVAIQPHFYRPATPEERGDGRVTLYTHRIGAERAILVAAGSPSPVTPTSSRPTARPAPSASEPARRSASSRRTASARSSASTRRTWTRGETHMRLAAQAKGGFYPTPGQGRRHDRHPSAAALRIPQRHARDHPGARSVLRPGRCARTG